LSDLRIFWNPACFDRAASAGNAEIAIEDPYEFRCTTHAVLPRFIISVTDERSDPLFRQIVAQKRIMCTLLRKKPLKARRITLLPEKHLGLRFL
jgi:hypothetical protein